MWKFVSVDDGVGVCRMVRWREGLNHQLAERTCRRVQLHLLEREVAKRGAAALAQHPDAFTGLAESSVRQVFKGNGTSALGRVIMDAVRGDEVVYEERWLPEVNGKPERLEYGCGGPDLRLSEGNSWFRGEVFSHGPWNVIPKLESGSKFAVFGLHAVIQLLNGSCAVGNKCGESLF